MTGMPSGMSSRIGISPPSWAQTQEIRDATRNMQPDNLRRLMVAKEYQLYCSSNISLAPTKCLEPSLSELSNPIAFEMYLYVHKCTEGRRFVGS